MSRRAPDPVHILLAVGLGAFLVAALSIVDMSVPRPYDGVLLESDALGQLLVRQVVGGSGADRAGIRPGDQIVGIAREILRSPTHAAQQLARRQVGEAVPYFIRSGAAFREVTVELGTRRAGDPYYVLACLLGFEFFAVGLFVLLRQPRLRASQVFYLMGALFMLFLICRLRPASYSRVDQLVLSTGTAALLFLPATFLHFFLIFPRPIWWGREGGAARPLAGGPPRRILLRAALVAVYVVPPLVLALAVASRERGETLALISGAPAANWWLLAAYMLLGLGALAYNVATVPQPRERRGAALVFLGTLFGLVPFLVLAVGFPSLLHTEKFIVYGVLPLGLVPAAFAYAIVRFQILDIRVLLKKSLLYTTTTAVITGLYALAIAAVGWMFRGTALATSAYSPLFLALAIVLLFEPLRRRLQVPVDRFFFAERARLERAAREMGEAFDARPDLGAVVRELVENLPQLLGLHFAALYLLRDERLERAAGPAALPETLPPLPALHAELRRAGRLVRTNRLGALRLRSREASTHLDHLGAAGVEVLGLLASARREIGLVLLSGKKGQMVLEDSELDLLRGLLQQAAMALETHRLVEERARQAELERDLEIAAAIQAALLPSRVELAPGWRVAAACRPARHVGGDFIAELAGPIDGHRALALGDVAGKSVSGALVMMATYEILSSLALTAREPEELLRLANQRLYRLGQKNFVALAYFVPAADHAGLDYVLAGQPQPLKRHRSGEIEELPLPEHRLPLGALAGAVYRVLRVAVEPGEVILGYSDGVVDARSPAGEFFGAERLRDVMASSSPEPGELVRNVLAAVSAFTAGSEPYDDVTLLAMSRELEVA